MAMDKEKLLAYFQAHYLSRQEVLFKLPLNYSIDQFWPELLNRRKASAAVLPLYNAAGMPYWYVLTDKMIAASERLCEEAIARNESFDPYRVEMTSAMTEEMFFTSFVEGAQIPLQEAMDFLSHGTEPESVQEQMIWNNRHAWSEMTNSIYRPLDEAFVKGLAWMLTQEMDGCAEDYRQADKHPIAAMNSEPYDVPSAYSLPERMNQYYAFLQATDTHPLIKAAMAQGYLLAIRPFPEGNERLSRMMSAAVLLRCGYDFFRDISISAVIARENYRYYKAMCDIIRPENGGDMTYFIEYYLELLVRAVDLRKERLRRKEEEAMTREREMAKEPLRMAPSAPQSPGNHKPPLRTAPEGDSADTDSGKSDQNEIDIGEHLPLESFLAQADRMKHSNRAHVRMLPKTIRKMIANGLLSFTVREWADFSNIDPKEADQKCRLLYKKGLLDKDGRGNVIIYTFRLIPPEGIYERTGDNNGMVTRNEEEAEQGADSEHFKENESPPISEDLAIRIRSMLMSESEKNRRSGEMIMRMIAMNQYTFLRSEWAKLTGLSPSSARDACDHLLRLEIIRRVEPDRKLAKYRINTDCQEQDKPLSQEIMDQITAMQNDPLSERDQRIGKFLLKLIGQGKRRFSTADWQSEYKTSSTVYGHDLRRAVNLGLIKKISKPSTGCTCLYKICSQLDQSVRVEDMTVTQKEYLTRIYDAFPQEEFTVEECGRVLNQCGSSASFHLVNFSTKGLLTTHRHKGRASTYTFAVTPTDNPECFALTDTPQEMIQQASDQGISAIDESVAVAV